MANNCIRMKQLQQLISYRVKGKSKRWISESLGLSCKTVDSYLGYLHFEIWLSKYYQTDEIIWPIQIWKRSECCAESIKEFYRVLEIFFAEYKNRK
jgi:hypothetical protein